MQKLIFALAVFACSNMAHAHDPLKVEELNQQVKEAGTQPKDCLNCSAVQAGADLDADKLMQSCVEAICPDQNLSLQKVYRAIESRSLRADAVFEKELRPMIRTIAKEEAEENLNKIKKLRTWMKSSPAISKPYAIRAVNMLAANTFLDKFSILETSYGKFVDAEKSRSAFPELSDEQFRNKVEIVNIFYGVTNEIPFPETNPERIRLLYPGSALKVKISSVLDELEKKSEKIKKNPDLNFLTQLPVFQERMSTTRLKSIPTDDEVNPDSLAAINQVYAGLRLYEKLSEDKQFQKLLTTEPIDINELAKKLNIEKDLKTSEEISTRIAMNKEPLIESKCRLAYDAGQELLMDAKQVVGTREKANHSKEKFLKKVSEYLSKHSMRLVGNDAKDWNLVLPPTKERHVQLLKESLKKTEEHAKEWRKNEQGVDASADREIFMAMGLLSRWNTVDDMTNLSDADDVCEKHAPQMMSDAAYSASSGFIVGPLVTKFESKLDGVTYHELGHLLYNRISGADISKKTAAWLGDTQACLIGNHANDVSVGMKYLSEDFADLVSSQLDDKSNNKVCIMAHGTGRAQDYTKLSMKNADEDDVHPSDLYRLLHLNFLKHGSLPAVCEQGLKAKGEVANFKNCLTDK